MPLALRLEPLLLALALGSLLPPAAGGPDAGDPHAAAAGPHEAGDRVAAAPGPGGEGAGSGAAPGTPPLEVALTSEGIKYRLDELEQCVSGLEQGFAETLRQAIGALVERRAAAPRILGLLLGPREPAWASKLKT